MIRLNMDNTVTYNNEVNIGNVYDLRYDIEAGLIIELSDGSIICIPEEDCTEDDRLVFEKYKELHKDDKPSVQEPKLVIPEPSIEERISAIETYILEKEGIVW